MAFRSLQAPFQQWSWSATDDRLNQFYIPLFREAVSYDRVTGYFRSSSLKLMAAGLSHFIARGGTMRLIAGADLADEDVRAIEEGEPLSDVLARRLLADPLEGVDILTEHRLQTLAWLVREGRLHIKVGVPVDHLGRPLRRDETDRYFHSKYGVFTDETGDSVAFEGSNNETAFGLAANHEGFNAFASWISPVWDMYGQPIQRRFDDHWHDQPDKGWVVVPLPEAVQEHLIARVKDKAKPPRAIDPEEERPAHAAASDAQRLAFVAAAPTLDGGTGVGFATAGVEPWPHQLTIAQRAVATYPRSYLLADEVGLGKTIEFGLILRELLISKRIASALLLVPASVMVQWQEELAEKFALDVPRFDQGKFRNRFGEEIPWNGGSPWKSFPVVLASSHLARRRERHDEVIATGPWDVVFVDEAHHARRSGSKPTATPNTLLSLLQKMKTHRAWKALYLASATPMQMHAHEAWDLLDLLGLAGRWGQSSEQFIRYYSTLREPFTARQWTFLQSMSHDFFADPHVQPDLYLTRTVKDELGLAKSRPIRQFAEEGLSKASTEELTSKQRLYLDEWLRVHTPMRERVFRTTRAALRVYLRDGLLPAGSTVPSRDVRARFVPMTGSEKALYDRIETYIARHYDAYLEANNKPLGFIMTVYRRRLTSSFLAIERSLERRLATLLGNASAQALLDADDLAALETSSLLDIGSLPVQGKALVGEVDELRSFLADLADRPPDESKMTYLLNEIEDAFLGIHNTVLIFTQYTDTMDYVRSQLIPAYGAKVICYSGRGGERWDPSKQAWLPVTKKQVKDLFREGREVKILIGTDSMSEGLNLQTCGKLINYDMPWNFMRVEQRIGRVDRINGRPRVDISNYFYRDTVEEQIYSGIAEDVDWFEDIVGPGQPVLGRVEGIIESVAMHQPGGERDQEVEQRIDEIRLALEEAKASPVTIDDAAATTTEVERRLATTPYGHAPPPVIDLADLEKVLLSASQTRGCFSPHPTTPGAYFLEVNGAKHVVTMRRDVLAEGSPDMQLLTYGTTIFEALLAAAGVANEPESGFGIGGSPVRSLAELDALLASRE